MQFQWSVNDLIRFEARMVRNGWSRTNHGKFMKNGREIWVRNFVMPTHMPGRVYVVIADPTTMVTA